MTRLTTSLILALFLSAPAAAASGPDARLDGPPSPALSGGFGAAMVFEEGVLYVGGPGDYPFFPLPASSPGAVHLYTLGMSPGEWNAVGSVTAAGSVAEDRFGASVAVAGEWMAVGAPGRDGRGAAYVFQRVDGQWQQRAELPSPGAAGGEFGLAVAMGEGVLAVAAPGRQDGTGGVDVYRRGDDGAWTAAGTLVASGLRAGDRFGTSLAMLPGAIAVGAPGPFPSMLPGPAPEFRAGSVRIFEEVIGIWGEGARFDGQPQSMTGWSMAVHGGHLFVGAPFGAGGVGLVTRYAPDGMTGRWVPAESIVPPEPLGPGFGFSLGFAGEDLMVGAPLSGPEGNGVAHLFQQSGGGWVESGVFQSGTAMSFFGASVAGAPMTAVIGAPGEDVFEGVGHVVIRDPASGVWRPGETIANTEEAAESIVGDVVECSEGTAASFGCSEVDLVAFLPVSAIGGDRGSIVNDVWGWTDPETGKEIAIVGRNDGTAFVDLSNPSAPLYLGELPATEGSTVNMWRDMKVYSDHAFIVADGAGAHGMQVFDLTQLRDVTQAPRTFVETAHYDQIFSAHNIVINPESGFAYIVGAAAGGEVCGGGLHMVDIRTPAAPSFAGCFSDPNTGSLGTGYSHDAMCVNYRGPDDRYSGKELCFGANENALSIADVTDKANPVAVASASYPNSGYLHQGWISEDHRYFYMNDELDELSGLTTGTRTLVWDIEELDDPILVKEHLGSTSASDHNLYVSGNFMYQSNYMSGLRILDVSDPENPREVGFFDTVSSGGDVPGFAGSWSNYPFFESGLIPVTSIKEGLFVVRKRPRIS